MPPTPASTPSKSKKRLLPGVPYPAGDAPASSEPTWLEPCPDDWFEQAAVSPEARYSARESVSLAFLVALQLLPARQRAILILCDVLDWQARETAALLDTTVPAVNNALRRARLTLQSRVDQASRLPPDDNLRAALDRYVRAWESADVASLTAMLKQDAVMSMPPSPAWFEGREVIGQFVVQQIFPLMGAASWRFQAVRANGQPAFAVYEPDNRGYQAHSIHVLRFEGVELAEMVVFSSPDLFRFFGLPDQLEAV